MCNQYYNQAGFSTPFTTQSTDMEAKNVFQHDQIIRQIDVLNNSVQSYSEQMEKRFQYIERKKRRSCTQKYLSQGSGGEIVLLEQYDDGTVEAKRFFENVSGTWNVLRIKFAFTEEMSSNYAIIFSNGCWIIGDIKKVTETMLYRSFIKAGIRFDARNTEVCIKKVLYETYAPELANCQNTVTIPELAGWYNHKFLHADSTGMICPKDILEIPIYEKHFIFMNKEGSNPKYFIEYIKNIKRINDRISCITILTSGILASILSEHGIERKHFINFIMLNSALSKELINLFTVFNRQVPAVIDASATKREISSFLTKVNDEELDGIVFDNAEESVERKEIEIIQLSGYGEQERKFAVTLLSEIYWEEVRQGKRKSEVVVFDEFQFLSLKPGSSLAAMLREGRKFSLAVYMSSQFLGNYSSEEIDTLMQAGNMLFFKPVPKERRLIAKYIDSKNWRQWEVILDDLNIGEAVLKGHFIVGQNQRVLTNPIKCSISLERGIENANLCASTL